MKCGKIEASTSHLEFQITDKLKLHSPLIQLMSTNPDLH